MHFTLTPRFNLLLLFAYCVVLVGVIALAGTKFLPTLGTSILLGAVLGYVQHRAAQATSQELAGAETAMDVRRALLTVAWGRRYVQLLWAGFVVIFLVALITTGRAFLACWIGGHAGLWLVRDAITYPDIVKLSRLSY
jgi:hypothetical protein